MKSLNKSVLIIATLFFSTLGQANLITNGSFEDNNVNESTWSLFKASDVNNWESASIEIWNSLNGVHALDGENHLELNAHPYTGVAFELSQQFNTQLDQQYTLDFAYRARKNNNESFKVDVLSDGNNVFSMIFDDHTKNAWSTFSGVFTATGNITNLIFTSITPNASVGNFLDAIVVEEYLQVTPNVGHVSSPASFLLLLLAAPLLLARKKK